MGEVGRRRAMIGLWPRSVSRLFPIFLLSIFLVGCGGGSPDPTPTPEATQIPTSTPEPPAELGHVGWATSIDPETKAPQEQVSDFSHDVTTIYAVVPVTRIKGETPVTAEWDYDGVAIPEFTTTVSAPDLPNGGWIEFHISRETNLFWPIGTYRVRISINGQVVQEGSVAVHSN